MAERPVIRLKKHEHKRVLHGHAWVFSNEIEAVEGSPETGAVVAVQDAAKNFLGVGFYNKVSLIAVRMLSRADEAIDRNFFARRIGDAAALREKLFPGATAFRLAHGESDFLPGLIIDRFNEYYAIQTLSTGMEKFQDEICGILAEEYGAKGVIAKNDSRLRTLEGLERETKILHGAFTPVQITDGEARYEIDVAAGQKTGFYFDQRENRKAIRRFAPGARVLDCYCNAGGLCAPCRAGGGAGGYRHRLLRGGGCGGEAERGNQRRCGKVYVSRRGRCGEDERIRRTEGKVRPRRA